MTITISLVLLTYNRLELASNCLRKNLLSANYPIKEFIHVDNGSGLGNFSLLRNPDIEIYHRYNQGVAKGYNRGMLLATSSHIVITGSDRLMPDNWLQDWVNAFERIPDTGVVSLYSHPTDASLNGRLRHRYTADTVQLGGLNITPSMPCEARMHSRDFLLKAGFFREDLGLYGYEDVEWVERAQRVAREQGLINYCISDQPYAEHVVEADSEEYKAFKKEQNDQPWKAAKVRELWDQGNPYYNPYVRIEK